MAVMSIALVTSAAVAGELARTEQLKAFKAAGFGTGSSECEQEEAGSYTPATIELVRDINDDGRPDALITEGSVACYGVAGSGFYLVSQQADADWKLLASGSGVIEFLPEKGADGWPDIQIGGPGTCFAVQRYDGKAYQFHHRAGSGCDE
ncbi:hypothetical protein J2W83_001112 [Pseudomonas hunanensis]|uniref:Uncharacterized protein n=1 Tax=Pseudomonas hunanensis TaxID=1247546 RepID=A0ACC6JZB0_9PSED|nr:hypothetical protein [Pseudomonas sp. BP8]MDR6711518.1 hypothetical protein [Pseudomonas hunanensis]